MYPKQCEKEYFVLIANKEDQEEIYQWLLRWDLDREDECFIFKTRFTTDQYMEYLKGNYPEVSQ